MSKTEILLTIVYLICIISIFWLINYADKLEIERTQLKSEITKVEKSRDTITQKYSEVCEENKKLKKENSELKEEIESWNKLENVKLTAYCPCEECSGQWGTKTKMGTTATEGRTIAVDPDVIPLGSKVKIGDKIYIAEDIGGAVNGKHIDIYFNDHKVDFKKYVDVLVRV